MRVQLSIACLVAATQAIDLSHSRNIEEVLLPNSLQLAQTGMIHSDHGDCCQQSTCSNPCCDHEDSEGEEDHTHIEIPVDETEIVLPEVKGIAEAVIDGSGVAGVLTNLVGKTEAEAIVNDMLSPVVSTEIANELLQVKEIEKAISKVETQEDLNIEDKLPSTDAVVKLIEKVVAPNHDEVTTLTGDQVNLSTEDIAKAKFVEIVDPATGNNVEMIIIEDPTGISTGNNVSGVTNPELVEPNAVPELIEPNAVSELVEPVIEPDTEDEPVPEPKEVEVYETTVQDLPTGMTLKEIVASAEGKPLVLDFQFDACGVCQTLAKPYEDMMKDNEGVVFYKVDVYDKANIAWIRSEQEIMDHVKAAPTFMVWDQDGTLPVSFVGESGFEPLQILINSFKDDANMAQDAGSMAQTNVAVANKFQALY